jgi:5'(3')-deoxyribonucleotidase
MWLYSTASRGNVLDVVREVLPERRDFLMGDLRRFVFGVDLDGVCADFIGGLRPIAAEWLGVDESTLTPNPQYGFPEWNLESIGGDAAYDKLHLYAITERNLFSQLKPIKDAPVVLRRLAYIHKVRIRIITHRLFVSHFHETAIRQTVEWLDKHGIPYYDLCFMKDKAAVGADLYIDDAPLNVEALRGDGHPTIVFANSTNVNLDQPRTNDWYKVQDIVLHAVEQWKADGRETRQSSGQ